MPNDETRIVPADTLRRVHFDNVRDAQIGGETDGISLAVAKDIGFTPLEDTVQIIADQNDPRNPSGASIEPYRVVGQRNIELARRALGATNGHDPMKDN